MINKLSNILKGLCSQSGDNFSGTGVLVYKNLTDIPVFPLRETSPAFFDENLLDQLLKISKNDNPYHDGFHLLSDQLKLTHYSQYFSPPIIKDISVENGRAYGGRYMAALFGSCLKNVDIIGIACTDRSIAIFKDGKEVHYEIVKC